MTKYTNLINTKVLLSGAMILAAAAVVIGATFAFFSDTETSTGNVLAAGAIDLQIDNESYVTDVDGELVLSEGTTWDLTDLTFQKFFNFTDLKPGDFGEDTISLHVTNNDAYVCAAAQITENSDVDYNEPELADDLTVDLLDPLGEDGELAENVNFAFWNDDGDNVYEDNETIFLEGPLSGLGEAGQIALADSDNNIWGPVGPVLASTTVYVGKAWCFGTLIPIPLAQGDNNPITTGTGFTCNGDSEENNAAQTDRVTGDIQFYAVQSRNNDDFTCAADYEPEWPEITRIDRTQLGFGDGGWAGWSCPADTTAVGGGIDSSTNPVGGNGVAAPGAPIVDGSTYPVYPHYTFGAGETGYVVHDLVDGLGNDISFHVDCQAD